MERKVNVTSRKSASIDLKVFDVLAKDGDFIQVTEWDNGEGFDISINEKMFHLTHGELEAINYLALTLNNDICTD